MKITVEIEVPDDFEPFTAGCADMCPFGYWDDYECGYDCAYGENDCPLLKVMKEE